MSVLEASRLTRRFADELAVSDVDLSLDAGQVHALVGLNGAGKTTLMRLLLGMLRPDSGRALILGDEVLEAPHETWRQVGHLIGAPFAYPELTVIENLRAAALLQQTQRSELRGSVARAIERFELGRWSDREARKLSTGNRQRLGLAAATIGSPRVLVLDEPANSLDPGGVVFTRELLRSMADSGTAVLVSSHHFDQVARIANQVTVIHRGQFVGSLDPAGVDLELAFFELVRDWDMRTEVIR